MREARHRVSCQASARARRRVQPSGCFPPWPRFSPLRMRITKPRSDGQRRTRRWPTTARCLHLCRAARLDVCAAHARRTRAPAVVLPTARHGRRCAGTRSRVGAGQGLRRLCWHCGGTKRRAGSRRRHSSSNAGEAHRGCESSTKLGFFSCSFLERVLAQTW